MGKRAQRIPSWPGVIHSRKAVYICADQLVTSSHFACGEAADHTFRLADHPSRTSSFRAQNPVSGRQGSIYAICRLCCQAAGGEDDGLYAPFTKSRLSCETSAARQRCKYSDTCLPDWPSLACLTTHTFTDPHGH